MWHPSNSRRKFSFLSYVGSLPTTANLTEHEGKSTCSVSQVDNKCSLRCQRVSCDCKLESGEECGQYRHGTRGVVLTVVVKH